MARIVIGWEYGAGFGHVALLVPLALRLKESGHEPILVLRDRKNTEPLWKDKGLTVVQAPFLAIPAEWDKTIPTDTMADIFILAGLSNAERMKMLGEAWQKVLLELKPDLVICEFSPTLAMVTLGVIPTITLGISFAVPPAGRTLPKIRYWQKELTASSIANERLVHAEICKVRQALGLPEFEFFADIFGGEEVFACALPELDCYAEYRTIPAIGPLTALEGTLAPPAHHAAHHTKAFAYLAHNDDNLEHIIEAMKHSTVQCDAYIRHLEPARMAAFSAPNLHIYETPQPLTELLPERGLLLHHGGMSTADLGLRLGIPQLIFSRHLEQKVNGGLLLRLGVGEVLMGHQCREEGVVHKTLASMVSNGNYKANAVKRAQIIAARPGRKAMEVVLEACERLVK
jgi:rhamnosyltransferase subunit B